MTPEDFLAAARVPASLESQQFGLWTIRRQSAPTDGVRRLMGSESWTYLAKLTTGTMHMEETGGEIVMEDSKRELSRHMPIWMAARGRVLITGLGLGCVVRGLLANPAVTHIDVVEIDHGIMRVVGKEFMGNPRVTLHLCDAMALKLPLMQWDYAWHDVHVDDSAKELHIYRFRPYAEVQGAWMLPRMMKRMIRERERGFIG